LDGERAGWIDGRGAALSCKLLRGGEHLWGEVGRVYALDVRRERQRGMSRAGGDIEHKPITLRLVEFDA
jgi:hypothetical protein